MDTIVVAYSIKVESRPTSLDTQHLLRFSLHYLGRPASIVRFHIQRYALLHELATASRVAVVLLPAFSMFSRCRAVVAALRNALENTRACSPVPSHCSLVCAAGPLHAGSVCCG
jgi:hypothetical protein